MPIIRVMIWNPAMQPAAAKGSSAAGWNTSSPGRMMISAPHSPIATPAQRRGPTCS